MLTKVFNPEAKPVSICSGWGSARCSSSLWSQDASYQRAVPNSLFLAFLSSTFRQIPSGWDTSATVRWRSFCHLLTSPVLKNKKLCCFFSPYCPLSLYFLSQTSYSIPQTTITDKKTEGQPLVCRHRPLPNFPLMQMLPYIFACYTLPPATLYWLSPPCFDFCFRF